jgi:hypothetical protein
MPAMTAEQLKMFAARALYAAMLLAAFCDSGAETLAPDGCPIFHCTPEATGVMDQPFVTSVLAVTSNSSLGSLGRQGCSGNGTVLACLFSTDEATGIAQGTLKVLDATTLQPIWGSAGAANSFNLNAATSAGGQVPAIFSNGTIAAGDYQYFVLYSAAGAVLGKVPLTGSKENFGLTPLSDTYGVVSQENSVLTLINMSTWQGVGTLTLADPVNGDYVHLVSPSSGAPGVLYAIAEDSTTGNGFLFSVALDATTNQLSVGSTFEFTGKSGATPVVVTPDVTGLPGNLVLLAVPGLVGEAKPQNHLLGLLDSPTSGLSLSWEVALPALMSISPTVDQASKSLFYHADATPVVHQNDLITGAPISEFNIVTIGGYPSSFVLNGHLGASESGSPFTLLLGGEYTTSPGVGAQFVITFQPIASPKAFLWTSQISSVPAEFLAAWNAAPSSQSGVICPVVVSNFSNGDSAIVRVCDF